MVTILASGANPEGRTKQGEPMDDTGRKDYERFIAKLLKGWNQAEALA
jgi:hypothetical protein